MNGPAAGSVVLASTFHLPEGGTLHPSALAGLRRLVLSIAVVAAALLARATVAHAGCNFTTFWTGGCNNDMRQALTPPPPSQWFPKPPPPPSCGHDGQRPCNVWEHIPSCKDGLTESIQSHTCVATPPGASPFLATLQEMGQVVIGTGKQAQADCLKYMNAHVQGVPTTGLFASPAFRTVSTQRLKYVAVGFMCASPRMLDMFKAVADVDPNFFHSLTEAFNYHFNSSACANAGNPAGRVACAVGEMVLGDAMSQVEGLEEDAASAFQDTRCMIAAGQVLSGVGDDVDPNSPAAITAYNKIGEGVFVLAEFWMEKSIAGRLGGVLRQKFKDKMVGKKIAFDMTHDIDVGDFSKIRAYEDRVDLFLFFVQTMFAVKGAVGLEDKLSKIPECQGELGPVPDLDGATADALSQIPRGSEAAVRPASIHIIDQQGRLLYYRTDAHARFAVQGKVVGNGWGGMQVIRAVSRPNGATGFYTVSTDGKLRYYEHDINGRFTNGGQVIGTGWGGFDDVFATRFGELYAVTQDGNLLEYRHNGNFAWTVGAKKIGVGWSLETLFSGGHGAFYSVADDDSLRYYYWNDDHWVRANQQIGTGWAFKYLASSGNGEIYAVNQFGELLFYRHDASAHFVAGSGRIIGEGWGNLGKFGLIVAQY